MGKIKAIAKKELMTYFGSPIAYIILIITLVLFNIFFYMLIEQNREASLQDVFKIMEFMFLFLIPILTMKLFSEEKLTGTMEFLMTAPITNTAIVLGKYLGTLIFFSLLIIMTFVYYFIVEYFGDPDGATIMMGYIGVWLEGAFFIAIGLMTSSWTPNQIVSAMVSYVILFMIYFSYSFTTFFSGNVEKIISYLSTRTHLENFVSGVISWGDIVYYLSGILVCILVTIFSIANRSWR